MTLKTSTTRTATSTRFNLKFFSRILKKIDTPEGFIAIFFKSLEKIVLLSILKEVKPTLDRKIIKLLTFDNSLPPLRDSR